MAEWSKAPDSKSGVGLVSTVGSNPTLSAKLLVYLCEAMTKLDFTSLTKVIASLSEALEFPMNFPQWIA